jgi:hypothetical protein
MSDKIKVIVAIQGDAIVSSVGYVVARSDKIVAFYLDGWGNTGRAYPMSTCDAVMIDGKPEKYPSMWIEDGEDHSQLTEIYFPEFQGWRIHCADGGKTMSICLVKSK